MQTIKTGTINVRIDECVKQNVSKVFERVGLSHTEAVRLFYTQVFLNQGLPFEVKIPNLETIEAMKESDAGGLKAYDSASQMFGDILRDD